MACDGRLSHLPGADLVAAGIEDLRCGEFSVQALLVLIGAVRLRGTGLEVPQPPGAPREPERALYEALCRQGFEDAHSRYNAYVRRLVSFERAVERLQSGRSRDSIL